MSRKSRLWVGITFFIVLMFNYAVIGFPLYRKASSLNDKATTMLMNRIKSGKALKNASEEEYILDIFRREKAAIDQKLFMLNLISISIAIVIASWTAFGLVFHKRK